MTAQSAFVADLASSMAPLMEPLESRLLLNAAPVFGPEFQELYAVRPNDSNFTIGLDAYDPDGDGFTVSVSSNPYVQAFVPTGNPHVRVHFTYNDGSPLGEVVVELFPNRAPSAVQRFLTLATTGYTGFDHTTATVDPAADPFYNDVYVHRIDTSLNVVQMGDKEHSVSGTVSSLGSGRVPLAGFHGEYENGLSYNTAGVLGMARAQAKDTNSGQFFFMTGPFSQFNENYLVFGHVVSGLEVLNEIQQMPVTAGTSRPDPMPILSHIDVIEEPAGPGTITFTPLQGWYGQTEVTVTLTDIHGNSRQETITILVVGEAPTMGTMAPVVARPGQSVSVPLSVTSNGDLPWAASIAPGDLPQGGMWSFEPATGLLTLTFPSSAEQTIFLLPVQLNQAQAEGILEPGTGEMVVILDGTGLNPTVEGTFREGALTGASVVHEGRLYVGRGGNVDIYDLTGSGGPTLLGSFETGGQVREIEVQGNTAYVADFWQGFYALNIANPQRIRVRSLVGVPGHYTLGFTIQDGLAFVAQYNSDPMDYPFDGGVGIYRVRPNGSLAPRPIGRATMPLDSSGYPTMDAVDIVVKDRQLFVAEGATGLIRQFDISNPRAPQSIRTLSVPHVWRLHIEGNRLYATFNVPSGEGAGSGLRIFDIADARHPVALETISAGSGVVYWDIIVRNHVAIASHSGGYDFINVTNPANPVQLHQIPHVGGQGYRNHSHAPQYNFVPKLNDQGMITLSLGPYGGVVLDAAALIGQLGGPVWVSHEFDRANPYLFTDADGDVVRVRLVGDGRGFVMFDQNAPGVIHEIRISAGDGRDPRLAIQVQRRRGGTGRTTVGSIQSNRDLQAIQAPAVDLTGDMTLRNIGRIVLGSAGTHGMLTTITLNSNAAAVGDSQVTILLGSVIDVALQTNNLPVHTLRVDGWYDTLGSDVEVAAPALQRLQVRGDFGADLTLTGSGGSGGPLLQQARVAGDILPDSVWKIDGAAGRIVVAGAIRNTDIHVAGDLNLLDARAVLQSNILVGMAGGVDFAGSAAGDGNDFDALLQATLGRLIVRGPRDRFAAGVQDSNISAYRIGQVRMHNVDAASDPLGNPVGIRVLDADGNGEVGAEELGNLRITYRTAANVAWRPGRTAKPELPVGFVVEALPVISMD